MSLPVLSVTPADAFNGIRAQGQYMRGLCLQLQEQFATGTVYAAFLLDVLASAVARLEEIPPMATVPGLGAYVRQQLADDTVDLTGPLQVSLGALVSLVTAITSEYPTDGQGRLLDRQFGVNGSVQWLTLPVTDLTQTSAATAAFLASLT